MFKKFLVFLIFAIIGLFGNNVSANSVASYVSERSISELQQELNSAQDRFSEVEKKLQELYDSSGNVLNYIKKGLSQEDFEKINKIIDDHAANIHFLDKKLRDAARNYDETEEIKNHILEEKRRFYKEIANFVDETNYSSYLEYIEKQVKITQLEKEVNEEIFRKEENLKGKVNAIQLRIDENKNQIENSVKQKIGEKLNKSLDELESSKEFQSLSKENRIFVYERMIGKVLAQKQILEEKERKTKIVSDQKWVYDYIVEIVEERIK